MMVIRIYIRIQNQIILQLPNLDHFPEITTFESRFKFQMFCRWTRFLKTTSIEDTALTSLCRGCHSGNRLALLQRVRFHREGGFRAALQCISFIANQLVEIINNTADQLLRENVARKILEHHNSGKNMGKMYHWSYSMMTPESHEGKISIIFYCSPAKQSPQYILNMTLR